MNVAPQSLSLIDEVFTDIALAVTTMCPPRTNKATIEALFDQEPDVTALTARLSILSMLHGLMLPKIIVKKIPSLDWLKKVAADFPPLTIARWVVHGAQHRDAAHQKITNRRLALHIDATSAFGTGEHPTTRGCLILLDHFMKHAHARCMLDIGCGSGILALAYAKACPGKAVAVDLDADSVGIAQSNMTHNGVRPRVHALLGNGYRDRLVKKSAPYDLIMANIFAKPLAVMAKELKRHLKPGGTAILSGILNHQVNQVLSAHRRHGLYLTRRLQLGEWSALALTRPKRAR